MDLREPGILQEYFNNNRLTPADRYQRDPVFRSIVDVLEQLLHKGDYTPTELREAAILAATIHENHTIRRYVYPGTWSKSPAIGPETR
jgi:hypothetical protein